MVLPNSANIVILSTNYNPSIVSKEWLYQKGILTWPVTNFVHTPVLSLLESEQFSLVVDEQRLQLALKKTTEDGLTSLASIAERFVKALPETPYRGVGINYLYTVVRERCGLNAVLSPNIGKLRGLFATTYEIGVTVLFQFERFVVSLTVSPPLPVEQQVRINFNFHSDVSNINEVEGYFRYESKHLRKLKPLFGGCAKMAERSTDVGELKELVRSISTGFDSTLGRSSFGKPIGTVGVPDEDVNTKAKLLKAGFTSLMMQPFEFSNRAEQTIAELRAENFSLRQRVQGIEERLAAIEKAYPSEKVIVLRELSKEQTETEIMRLFSTGRTLYYSDIAEELGLDLALVVEICNELESRGEVQIVDDHLLQAR